MHALKIKRVYDEASQDDGLRILVDRLWPRGLSRTAAAVDLWLKDIAPSNALRKWFGHRPERWHDFRNRYHNELDAKPAVVEELKRHIAEGPVTLLYAARDAERNHALSLLEYLFQSRSSAPDVHETAAPNRGLKQDRKEKSA